MTIGTGTGLQNFIGYIDEVRDKSYTSGTHIGEPQMLHIEYTHEIYSYI